MHPANETPPHCPYFCTGVQLGAVGDGAALVTKVVGAGADDGVVAGGLPESEPEPFHTAGPGIGYVVAFLAASESMLKAMPGSVAE